MLLVCSEGAGGAIRWRPACRRRHWSMHLVSAAVLHDGRSGKAQSNGRLLVDGAREALAMRSLRMMRGR